MKIEALVCDMDGTLVDYPNEPFRSSWDALAEVFSEERKKEWTRMRDFYYSKKELYREWYREQVALLRGISIKDVAKYLFPVPYSSGVLEFFSTNNNFLKGVITSGVSLVADRIVKELGFDFSYSNILRVGDGKFARTGEEKVCLWDKDQELLKIVKEYSLDLKNVIYIGDNENDIPVFRIVGIPIAFKPKTGLTKTSAKYIINDFRELNYILDN